MNRDTQYKFAEVMLKFYVPRTNKKLERVRANRKVYFMLADGLVKVGYSLYPEQRLRELQTAQPAATLLGYIPGGTKLEKEIHKRLAPWRYSGEWFFYNDETAAVVKEYLNGHCG